MDTERDYPADNLGALRLLLAEVVAQADNAATQRERRHREAADFHAREQYLLQQLDQMQRKLA